MTDLVNLLSLWCLKQTGKMAFIREKEISGNHYLYLVKNVREGGKTRQKVLAYLGKAGEVTVPEELKRFKGKIDPEEVEYEFFEKTCIKEIDKIQKRCRERGIDLGVIGGFAVVSSLSRPIRFRRRTDDLDFKLTDKDKINPFKGVLAELGYDFHEEEWGISANKKVAGETIRIHIGVGEAEWTEKEVEDRKIKMVSTESLLAGKFHSWRARDKIDTVLLLLYSDYDPQKLSKKVDPEKIKGRLKDLLDSVGSKEFRKAWKDSERVDVKLTKEREEKLWEKVKELRKKL